MEHLGPSWGRLGAVLGYLGAFLGHLKAILGHLGVILGHLGAIFGHFGVSWCQDAVQEPNIDFPKVFSYKFWTSAGTVVANAGTVVARWWHS